MGFPRRELAGDEIQMAAFYSGNVFSFYSPEMFRTWAPSSRARRRNVIDCISLDGVRRRRRAECRDEEAGDSARHLRFENLRYVSNIDPQRNDTSACEIGIRH